MVPTLQRLVRVIRKTAIFSRYVQALNDMPPIIPKDVDLSRVILGWLFTGTV
jgi:hypothetical protein